MGNELWVIQYENTTGEIGWKPFFNQTIIAAASVPNVNGRYDIRLVTNSEETVDDVAATLCHENEADIAQFMTQCVTHFGVTAAA